MEGVRGDGGDVKEACEGGEGGGGGREGVGSIDGGGRGGCGGDLHGIVDVESEVVGDVLGKTQRATLHLFADLDSRFRSTTTAANDINLVPGLHIEGLGSRWREGYG